MFKVPACKVTVHAEYKAEGKGCWVFLSCSKHAYMILRVLQWKARAWPRDGPSALPTATQCFQKQPYNVLQTTCKLCNERSSLSNEMPYLCLTTSGLLEGEADDEDDTPFSGLSALSHEQVKARESLPPLISFKIFLSFPQFIGREILRGVCEHCGLQFPWVWRTTSKVCAQTWDKWNASKCISRKPYRFAFDLCMHIHVYVIVSCWYPWQKSNDCLLIYSIIQISIPYVAVCISYCAKATWLGTEPGPRSRR